MDASSVLVPVLITFAIILIAGVACMLTLRSRKSENAVFSADPAAFSNPADYVVDEYTAAPAFVTPVSGEAHPVPVEPS
jgi:hypothetical protein